MLSRLGQITLAVAALLATAAAPAAAAEKSAGGFGKLNHIVVVYLENHSFDNLFGTFPGANGISRAGKKAVQVDSAGKPYATLPAPINSHLKPPAADNRFPAGLANRPFLIDLYVPAGVATGDLVHRYYQQIAQIDGGRMDRFAAVSDAAGLAMGYYEGRNTALWRYAADYTLADNFFHAALGGSFLNHMWLVCACTPRYDAAPAAVRATLDGNGKLLHDGAVTPDGFAVNTIFSVYQPHPARIADKSHLLPPVTLPTIGDRLSDKGVTWAWYSGGWDDALAGKPDKIFQYHHQPLAYFRQFADGSAAKAEHLKDERDLLRDIAANRLPAVTFYKPIGEENEHPGYADVITGDRHVAAIIDKIMQSPAWPDTAIIVTYDENGGYWDHVPPPKGDRWGPGARVPTIVISPYAKRGFVDHTRYDTTSILRLIESRFDLAPLGERDARAANMQNAFDFAGTGAARPQRRKPAR